MTDLLAIDPGKMTGVCRVQFDPSTETLGAPETAEIAMTDIYSWLWQTFDSGAPEAVALEDFKITPGTGRLGSPDWSLRIIGAVEMLAEHYGVPVRKQPPANAKAFATNDRLRALGLWHRGGAGHANDASRHAVLYMVHKGWTALL